MLTYVEIAKAIGGVDHSKYDKLMEQNLSSSATIKLTRKSKSNISSSNSSSSNSSSSSSSSSGRYKDRHNEVCEVCEKGGDL